MRFYSKRDMTLNEVINQMKAVEIAERQLNVITPSESDIHNVNQMNRTFPNRQRENTQRNSRSRSRTNYRPEICKTCGGKSHMDGGKCRALDNMCNYCGLKGHYFKVCNERKRDSQSSQPRVNTIATTHQQNHNTVSEVTVPLDDDDFVLTMNHSSKLSGKEHIESKLTFVIKGRTKEVYCQLDTGATCNVIGYRNYCELVEMEEADLRPTTVTIRCFGGAIVKPLGEAVLMCSKDDVEHFLVFQVVSHAHQPLLSASTCRNLSLIKICNKIELTSKNSEAACRIIKKYDHLFHGIGKFEKTIHLEVDETVKPLIDPPRRIAVAMKTEFAATIKELVQQGVVEKVETHTDWVSNVLLVKRGAKLRPCLDPVHLNRALKRVNYQIPTIDELLPELSRARVFTTLDAKHGFWQLELDYESSLLTTFWGPDGRYRWKRCPFGISPAPELFQQRLHEVLYGLTGVVTVADDILVYGVGNTDEEALVSHNINLECVLFRLAAANLRLNGTKVKLCQDEVKFYGHLLTKDGIKVDQDKVDAIRKMPVPTDAKAIQRFLGMVTYLNRYIPNLSTQTAPLRELTHNDVEFCWTNRQQASFEELKRLLMTAPVLAFYDVTKPVVIQCDSSSVGLGAALLQGGRPIAYASRALTKSEERYAQIEKETLAIVFACLKFDQYISTKFITVESDHKPLEIIFAKPLSKAPKRLQRMLLALQGYRVKIVHVKGTSMHLADTLSRAFVEDPATQIEQKFETVNAFRFMKISDERIKAIQRATTEDEGMQQLTRIIHNGWPEMKDQLPAYVCPYFQYRDEMTTQNGIVFKGQRIVVPQVLRAEVLGRLHSSHGGIEATLRLARDIVFWPGITDQITNKVKTCQSCIQNSCSQSKQPMQSVEIPDLPFQTVSMDLMELMNPESGKREHYLITVDHYSDFFEIDEVEDLTAASVIKKCKRNFATHGIPEVTICDNGSQFNSTEFRKFAAVYEFKVTMCSPYHKEGNGKAEATVKIAKQLIKKCRQNKQDIHLALLTARNTPNKVGSSPAQRLFSRRTRCSLPFAQDMLVPMLQEDVTAKISLNKREAKYYHDRKAKPMPELNVGEQVYVKLKGQDDKWTKGQVQQQVKSRSYDVTVNDRTYRRNQLHIKPANIDPVQTTVNDQSEGQLRNVNGTPQKSTRSQSPTPEATRASNSSLEYRPSSVSSPSSNQLARELPITSTPLSHYVGDQQGRPARRIRPPVRFSDYVLMMDAEANDVYFEPMKEVLCQNRRDVILASSGMALPNAGELPYRRPTVI
jgi:RNase H-like domain found in reverse transcriptase/Reverse transcriptase (RNA-dependent DNA polymerase)/Integrase zinc binding domain/Integrase core domain